MPRTHQSEARKLKNDGWAKIAYDLDSDKTANSALNDLLNEVAHVFRHHANGHWKQLYKPKYASALAVHLQNRPSLIRKLLEIKDPVIRNITYAAIEAAKENATTHLDRKQATPKRGR